MQGLILAPKQLEQAFGVCYTVAKDVLQDVEAWMVTRDRLCRFRVCWVLGSGYLGSWKVIS